jgi:hypothetical protein
MTRTYVTLWQYLGGSPLSRIEVGANEIQGAHFMPDGTIFIVYDAGDCDQFLPFVRIA